MTRKNTFELEYTTLDIPAAYNTKNYEDKILTVI